MKRLLVLNFFPSFYPPASGGEQRYHYLYKYLSRHFDVTLLSPTYAELRHEMVFFNEYYREHRVPKDPVHGEVYCELQRQGIGVECSALAYGRTSKFDKSYRRRYRELVDQADVIILDNPVMLDYDERFGLDGKPRIYASHNVESILAGMMFGGPDKAAHVAYIQALERRLVLNSALVSATSREDKQKFIDLYRCDPDKVVVTPNGFEPLDISATEFDGDISEMEDNAFALFFGSGHPPNVEAARFLCEVVAPSVPEVIFALAGAVCNALPDFGPNVRKLGYVGENYRSWLLSNCMAALNPMFTGSGSNLKMVDYMAAGTAIVTTSFGARGFDVRDGVHCLICERTDFAEGVLRLFKDSALRKRLGSSAHELAYSSYTWSSIADRLYPAVLGTLPLPNRQRAAVRPKILLLNDFSLNQRFGGGQVRMYEIYRRLAKTFDVTLLCFSDSDRFEQTDLALGFTQISVPKTQQHVDLERRINSVSIVSANDILSVLLCRDNSEMVRQISVLSQIADVIVFCHPYLAPLLEELNVEKPVIYEALNIEADLKRQMLENHPYGTDLIRAVELAEASLCSSADTIVCVSHDEQTLLQHRYPDRVVKLVRNGVHIDEDVYVTRSEPMAGRPICLFIGSGHMPNVQAVDFIVSSLAPRLPHMDFHIVGTVCGSFQARPLPTNVLLRGFLDHEAKRNLMKTALIGLNPLTCGGGSSLKLGDFFAAGVPVVSTPLGIRGYEVSDGDHVLVADLPNFATAVERLIEDDRLRSRVASRALDYARSCLDWDRLAESFATVIQERIKSAPKPKLLVVTYRYTTPPRGGAEVYLDNLVRELHSIGDFQIDLATTTVETIEDRFHFSAYYSGDEAELRRQPVPAFMGKLLRFPFTKPPEQYALSTARVLQRSWDGEALRQARQFLSKYQNTILMGGWYHPEKTNGGVGRWSGTLAEIFCPAGVTGISLSGFVAEQTTLRVRINGKEIARPILKGNFTFKVRIDQDAAESVIVIETESQYRADWDHRKLGIFVTSIVEWRGEESDAVALTNDFEVFMRRFHPAEWVASLVKIARMRPIESDSLFHEIRGPHSDGLLSFLQQSAHGYDAVLVQGIPFSTTVIATKAIKESGLPVVLLPHFHMEDRYYHWRAYCDAFIAADAVLTFPNAAKTYVMDPLGAKAYCIPGGGVDLEEFTNLEARAKHFRSEYNGDRPFILVLGRKAGSKNYRTVIDAIELLNANGPVVDLVMIGPDEDGVPVEHDFVTYLGSQPREMVLGALASCLCLVNMSESESFGIVIVESWMCGRPVIVNGDCAAFSELVEHERDGFLCRSPKEVAFFIDRLRRDSSLQHAMGETGKQKAVTNYTWTRIALLVNQRLKQIVHQEAIALQSA